MAATPDSSGANVAVGDGQASHPAIPWLNRLDAARNRARAATAVLLDAKAQPGDAWVLLDLGWQDLLTVVTHLESHPAPPTATLTLGALLALLAEQPMPGLPASQRTAWRNLLMDLHTRGQTPQASPNATAAVRRDFLRLSHQLDRCARACAALVKARHGRRPFVWPVRQALVTLAGVTLSAALGWALAHEPPARETGWRAEYFSDDNFGGKPLVRRDPAVTFLWHEGPAIPGGPTDHFSVRWDTCLKLAEKASVTFNIGSDDGSRLTVDGQLVVDNWGGHLITYKEGTIILPAGTHHLHLDYQELDWMAGIIFKMGLGKRTPTTPDANLLIFPGLDAVGEHPCQGM